MLFYDLKNSRSYAATVRTQAMQPGHVAQSLNRLVVNLYDSEGRKWDNGIVAKENQTELITRREYAILQGIRGDELLHQLRVSAPVMYGQHKKKIVMQNLLYPTLEEYLAIGGVSLTERTGLLSRVVRATEVIEERTPIYLGRIDRNAEVKGGEQVADLGTEHKEAVNYLRKKGMFNIWLSDSRLGNWIYDTEDDMLYKIDENTRRRGSKFGCLAFIADYNHSCDPLERDFFLSLMKPADINDALLSLYVTNMESALYFKKIGNEEIHWQRIEIAHAYLQKLATTEPKWLSLKHEFEMQYVPQTANTRAA